jgi:hypothetical protein
MSAIVAALKKKEKKKTPNASPPVLGLSFRNIEKAALVSVVIRVRRRFMSIVSFRH